MDRAHLIVMLFFCPTVFGCPGSVEDKTASPGDDSSSTDSASHQEDTGPCTSQTWYADVDSDDFGDAAQWLSACERPSGYVANADDCDDTNPDRYPGAAEICGDGVANDCDDTTGAAATAACPTEGPYSVTAADAMLLGESRNDLAGWDVSSAGDVNGDGHADLLVGAKWGAGGTGAAYRVLGPVTGAVSLSLADAELVGGGAGWSVANGGDQDGDGLPEMFVGAPGAGDDLQGAGLLLDPNLSGEVNSEGVTAALTGEAADDNAGYSVAGLGDTNGDGWDDLLIGAPFTTGAESTTGHCADEDPDEFGDEGGDGAGTAYLVRGPVSADIGLAESDARLVGEDGNDIAGYKVSAPGDVNGDGLSDLLVASPLNCEAGMNAGAVYVVYSPTEGDLSLADADLKGLGEHGTVGAGKALSGAGDVDGDGYGDLVVGSQAWDSDRGAAYVLSGATTGIVALVDAGARLEGERDSDVAGCSVASAGDVDLDGYADLLIGAHRDDTAGSGAGAVYLLYGPVSGSDELGSADSKFVGAASPWALGYSVSSAGDMDADGRPDLFLGAPGANGEAENSGAAYLILSSGPIMSGGYGP